jgi:serine/threonine protein kinase
MDLLPTDLLRTSSLKGKSENCKKYFAIKDYGEVEDDLASGSFGSVQRRTKKIEEKDILSKRVKASDDNQGIDIYLIHETSIALSLESPFMIKLYDIKVENNTAELYLPYGGPSLSSVIKEGHPNEDEFKGFIYECLIYLAQLQSRAIIHGDIKPPNILVNDGSPLFIDFGGSLQSQFLPDGSILKVKASIGTQRYMSPERLLKFPISNKDDIWALGCVWVDIIAKTTDSANHCLEQVRIGDYSFLRSLFSEKAYELIRVMLESDPEGRVDAFEALKSEYFFDVAKDIDFPAPVDVLEARELEPFKRDKDVLIKRENMFGELLYQIANMKLKISNRTYFLTCKLFDVLIYENPSNINNRVKLFSCLLLAMKFNNESHENILDVISTRIKINHKLLYDTERTVYKELCFNVNYSTSYDYLILSNGKDLVRQLRLLIRLPGYAKLKDYDIATLVVEHYLEKPMLNRDFKSDFPVDYGLKLS